MNSPIRRAGRSGSHGEEAAAGVRLHNHYYRALRQPNCLLITWPAPLGIRTVDGAEHRVDCIIYAEDMP
ncbi:hypothetical protein [Nocardia sp. NBC_01388]|uniref:hypothetical protein n=1 Tax=Nocardia sp. NBC_01388 TaxID=2903596 RepID=UPI003245728C